jgi:very-short-patch-repair endonuclease
MASQRSNIITMPRELSPGEEAFAFHCHLLNLKPEREVKLIPGREWRFDFYWPEHNLAVEIEGATRFGKSRHSKGEGFENDARKYNAAAIAGIRLLRFTTKMVKTAEAIDTVMAVLSTEKL